MQPDEFLKLLQGPTATIYVGREQVPFAVPMNLACRQCPFFKERFDKAFGDQNASLHLPDEDPKAFAMFAQWLYQEKLSPAEYQDIWDTLDAFMGHIALYYLASRLKTPRLQNDTMELLRALYIKMRCSEPIDVFIINQVYRNAHNNSTLRRFVCDAAAWEISNKSAGQSYKSCEANIPAFAQDFIRALREYHLDQTDSLKTAQHGILWPPRNRTDLGGDSVDTWACRLMARSITVYYLIAEGMDLQKWSSIDA